MKKLIPVILFVCLISASSLYAADAPVTMAANVVNAVPGAGSVPIPVTVNGFNNIGQFTLTLKFDTTRVHYISSTTNALLTGMSVTYTSPVGNTQGKLVFAWTGASNVSLADGSSLVNLTFSYVSGTGILSWAYSFGSICRYKRYVGGVLTTLNDSPQYLFYKNGGISNQGAPVTYAPVIPVTSAGPLPVPVTVSAFTGVAALTLYMEYNPAVITYQNTFTKNPVFGSAFQVGNNPGTNGMMLIVIQWYGNEISLADGSTLCTLNFVYNGPAGTACELSWYDNGPSCEYADASSVFIDLPTSGYYHNGMVGPPVIADFTGSNMAPHKNETVHLTDLSSGNPTSWYWSFDRTGAVFVNGTSSSSQNPQVMFTDGGPYTVTLTSNNTYFTDTEVKPGYILTGVPGLWTGVTSSDWYTLSNWDNMSLPDSTTEVTIPPIAPNWPVFDGDIVLGVHCSKLSLLGSTSMMTVTGNFTIP